VINVLICCAYISGFLKVIISLIRCEIWTGCLTADRNMWKVPLNMELSFWLCERPVSAWLMEK
jgi:hypothetical protein